MGSEKMMLFGGVRGNVPFSHRLHQDRLNDCDLCHSVFPRVSGTIEEMKKKAVLKKKQVMNDLCVKCHRDKKKNELESGPTTCSRCHTNGNIGPPENIL